ncbi:hypothetical protein EBR57_01785 [bacterium]|nr:hypothetical protein [bacterium]
MFPSSPRNDQPGQSVQNSTNPFARKSKPTNPIETKHLQSTETPKPIAPQNTPIVQPSKPKIIEVSVSTDSFCQEGLRSSSPPASRTDQPTRIDTWESENNSNHVNTPHIYSPEQNPKMLHPRGSAAKTDETLHPIAKRLLERTGNSASDDLHIDDRQVYHSTQNHTDGRHTQINLGPTHSAVSISRHKRYTISTHIESGAAGTVDRGKQIVQTRSGIKTTDVALKQIFINTNRDLDDQNDAALREYEILKYLDHIEGVIRCFDVFPSERQSHGNPKIHLNLALELGGQSSAQLFL